MMFIRQDHGQAIPFLGQNRLKALSCYLWGLIHQTLSKFPSMVFLSCLD